MLRVCLQSWQRTDFHQRAPDRVESWEHALCPDLGTSSPCQMNLRGRPCQTTGRYRLGRPALQSDTNRRWSKIPGYAILARVCLQDLSEEPQLDHSNREIGPEGSTYTH